MARPIRLFTGRWADLPFTEVARLAGDWGYDGLEVACSGDHLDERRVADDDGNFKNRLDILESHGVKCFRMLNAIGYTGQISIEWEDAGMDRLVGAAEAMRFVRRLAFDPPAAAFDAAFARSARPGTG
jgi:sugar phosphate isomerase/epimerase